MIAADRDPGVVRYRTHGRVHRIFEKNRASGLLQVAGGANEGGLDIRFAELLPDIKFANSD